MEKGDNLVSGHRWKSLQKLVDGITRLQVIEQMLDGHARPTENRGSAHHLGVARNNRLLHGNNILLRATYVQLASTDRIGRV